MTTLHRLLESTFDQCSDRCGWTAAVIAALAYGTYGVPVKETVSIDVHPLVLQSYKTVTMFAMSWLVVLMGESIRFTNWGILSGLLWVLGGTGGIYGIRNAGMSVAVGTWSSCMVIINFLFGILIFQEPVASISSTFAAFVLLGLGLVGMSAYSAPSASVQISPSSDASTNSSSDSNNPLIMETELMQTELDIAVPIVQVSSGDRSDQVTARSSPFRSRSHEELERNYDPLALGDPAQPDEDPSSQEVYEKDGVWRRDDKKESMVFLGNNNHFGFTKRQLGILGAVINGFLTGSSLIPIHYAKKQGFGGAAYMLSFATGAVLSNLLIWAFWFVGKLILSRIETTTNITVTITQMITQTYESMPPIYFRQLWAPGFSAGILLAIAMFGSIMSVTYLGQGVGNSIIQSKILISGLWGIFYYKEITGGINITKWFASAALAVSGILWLSYERIHAKAS